MSNKIKLTMLLLAAVAIFVGTLHFGTSTALHWLLKNEAKSTGTDWARHIEARLPELLGIDVASGSNGKIQVPTAKNFGSLASDILAVGNIYQIDFINPNCYCDASIGTYLNPPGKSDGQPIKNEQNISRRGRSHEFDHQASKAGVLHEQPSQAHFTHVASNHGYHAPMAASEAGDLKLPIDRGIAESIVASKKHDIVIRTDAPANQPSVFAEVFYPVISEGETVYLLRVLVDLQNQAVRYRNLLYSGTLGVLLLVILSFGYPAKKYLTTSKRQKETDRRAHFLANHDVLTGISNRNSFQETAPVRLDRSRNDDGSATLFLVDIDNFKEINDYHGHHAGDLVLKEVATRLKSAFGSDDIVARLGGDEFAVLVDRETVDFGTGRSFELPASEGSQNIAVSLCVGLARFPRDADNLPDLLRNADLALYDAKKSASRGVRVYDPAMGSDFENRLQLVRDFRTALERSEIVPYYQPLVSAKTGHVESFEALARWNHPERGILSPAVFHEALEDRDICEQLGRVMLKKALTDMAGWKSAGVPFGSVAINVTEADLTRPGFALEAINGLSGGKLARGDLAIEVTEGCIFGSNKDVLLAKLQELRNAGCNIGLDDFGTGYSSITHIKELPRTSVKIDKSFIKGVVEDSVDQAIVQALVDLGRSVGFKLIAEGVETVEQLDLVHDLGCNLVQGYYYSKPVAGAEVPGLIARINNTGLKRAS